MKIVLLPGTVSLLLWSVHASAAGCGFSNQSMSFAGDQITQARCLLRPVMKGGSLGARMNQLPQPFEHFIGQPVNVTSDDFLVLLGRLDIAPDTGRGGDRAAVAFLHVRKTQGALLRGSRDEPECLH